MPNPRAEYKKVWNVSSRTLKDAVTHVQGDVGEDELHAAGEETLKDLQATVGVNPDDIVLEIGCGVGRVGKVIAPLCKEWIGCDVSTNMLMHAKGRLKNLRNVRLVEISGFDLKPIPDASVDLVYCTVVFMHLDEWDRYNYVLEAMRVLRPGGRVFVDNFTLCHDLGWQVFETLRTTLAPEQRPPHISKSSTPAEIEAYLTRAGFQSIHVREKNEWIQGWGHRRSDMVMDRISIVKSLVDGGGRGLEIGPSYNPIFPKRDGYAVESVDHAPAAALRAKYAATDVDLTRIEEVDYIWSGEPLETLIPRRHYYDYIFAGHVIEHLPDPLAFFSAAAELLREDGSLVLAVPDKHYCFDCFGRLSSAGEILQAHAERRRRHGAGAIFDHVAYMAAQRGKTSWGPETTGAPDFLHNLDEAVDAHARSAESEAYVDVHAWRFTPSSFRLIFHDLLEAGFVGLREARFHDTVGNEFFIAFGLHGDGCPVDRRTLALRAISEQAAAAQNYGLASLPLGKAKAKAQRSRLPRYY